MIQTEERAMIRLLTDADQTAVTNLLNQEPQLNLYMLGNLEKLGFAHELSQFWGDFAEDGALRAVLNRYMSGWAIYGRPEADWSALGGVLDTHPVQAHRLQDNPGGVPSFLPYLQCYQDRQVAVEELMDLGEATFRPMGAPAGVTIRRATMADLEPLVAFYADADDMVRTAPAVARPIQDTRLWFAEEKGEILAAALTNAETRQLAMIGGVFTKPAARGRGLSQAVCSALCQDLFAAGLQPVLYWGKPAAGAVYRKLGFRPIGHWRAVWLERRG
jgi:uncharacterized protein